MYDRITILHTFFLTFTLHIYIYLYIFKDRCVLLNNSLKFPTKHGIKEFLYRALKDSGETNKYEFLLLLFQNCIQKLLSYYTKSLFPFQVFTLPGIETNTNPGILQREFYTGGPAQDSRKLNRNNFSQIYDFGKIQTTWLISSLSSACVNYPRIQ